MIQSPVAVLSQDPRFHSEMQLLLETVSPSEMCHTADELQQTFKRGIPLALVVDNRLAAGSRFQSDGDAIDERLLEDLRQRFPELLMVFMRPEGACEAPISLHEGENIVQLETREDFQRVNELIERRVHDAAKVTAGNGSAPANRSDLKNGSAQPRSARRKSSETVLSGMTRQFETKTPKLKRILDDLEVAARHDVTILIIGETGTGKTFLSNLIHEVSPRRDEPFLHVACGALPAELIESELFGHVKGAFTSAHANKDGKFVAAKKGTILLDEIDLLGPEQQVKLLRVIEAGEFEPVGSNRTLTSQARLVVASNLNLQPLVEQGRFRPDLYYRLNMLKFEIPPLRERPADIEPLARKCISQLSRKHDIDIKHIDDDFFNALFAYPWPGNVREMENAIQRAVIYSNNGALLARELPPHILEGVVGPTNDPTVALPETKKKHGTLGRQIALTARDILAQALFTNNFSRTNTARALGISRVTLYNKMKKYEMTK